MPCGYSEACKNWNPARPNALPRFVDVPESLQRASLPASQGIPSQVDSMLERTLTAGSKSSATTSPAPYSIRKPDFVSSTTLAP